jgi:hypothetical protein
MANSFPNHLSSSMMNFVYMVQQKHCFVYNITLSQKDRST